MPLHILAWQHRASGCKGKITRFLCARDDAIVQRPGAAFETRREAFVVGHAMAEFGHDAMILQRRYPTRRNERAATHKNCETEKRGRKNPKAHAPRRLL